MGKISRACVLLGAVAVFSKFTTADRACGSNSAPSYVWRVSDARFDGAVPNDTDGKAVVAVSIIPNTTNTFFECVAEWPEAWAGWSPTDGNIIWSDCIWSGAGPTLDTAVAFAVDWKNRTMYLSHTFACSDTKGSDSMATGSFNLDLDCKNADDESTHCTMKSKSSPGLQVTTVPGAPRLAANASCEDNTKVYQSWQLENWHRQYKLTPGDPITPPPGDSGPSFTLRNLANGGVFDCAPGNKTEDNVFDGVCTAAAGANVATNTKASFRFDPILDMLVVTQKWECGAEMAWSPSCWGYRDFEYPSICSNPRAFRLIKLNPPTRAVLPPFRETLNIEIIEADIDEVAGEYDTLSYCWGGGAANRTIIISLSKNHGELRAIRVSASLELTLLSLARETNICINQADKAEKVQQVQLMGEVYAKGARTIIWLGEGTTETSRYFDFLSELSSEGVLSRVMGPNVAHYMKVFDAVMDSSMALETEAEKEDRNDILDLVSRYGPRFPLRGLSEMLRRAWLNRVWTVQEGCLPTSLIFRCGEKSLCYDCVRGGLLFHSIWTTYWVAMPKGPISKEEIQARNEIYRRKTIHGAQAQRRSLYDTVVQYNVNGDRPKIGTTKAEDRIYALLETVEGMEVDNVKGTFTKFASSVIKRNVDVLLFSQIPKSPAHGRWLPSWVPDWSADPLRLPYGYSDLTTADDIAADASTGVLRVNAILVGRVIRVGACGIRSDDSATIQNVEFMSFMEEAAKISAPHAPDISNEEYRLDSLIRLSDGGLSARQFPTRFNSTTAAPLLREIHTNVSHWGKKFMDVEAQTKSLSSFTGMIRSAGVMPWHWTPGSEIDAIRFGWVRGLLLAIYDVGWVMWYLAKLRLVTATIRLRQRRAKLDFNRPARDAALRNWELYTSNLFKNIGRKLFLTDTGYVDAIVVIPGSSVPNILRRLDVSSWVYVGEAYCDGIMDGELVNEREAMTTFEIV
ncbi:heterokaryon incompatibility protein-domain-containing protein [Nemania sp. FL0031]|nr:heterokaryon incompatibility protein-domain-containing protein [Nemania sp. FL0031]